MEPAKGVSFSEKTETEAERLARLNAMKIAGQETKDAVIFSCQDGETDAPEQADPVQSMRQYNQMQDKNQIVQEVNYYNVSHAKIKELHD
jgi:hypothetical protein